MPEYLSGINCPHCDKEMLYPIKHLYNRSDFGLKWFHCDGCDKDVCKDKFLGSWKIAAYDFDPSDYEEDEEDNEEE